MKNVFAILASSAVLICLATFVSMTFIYNDEMDASDKICAAHQGVEKLRIDMADVTVRCKDGTHHEV